LEVVENGGSVDGFVVDFSDSFVPMIRLRHVALQKCVLTDWLIKFTWEHRAALRPSGNERLLRVFDLTVQCTSFQVQRWAELGNRSLRS